jgi:hypothetical protein
MSGTQNEIVAFDQSVELPHAGGFRLAADFLQVAESLLPA